MYLNYMLEQNAAPSNVNLTMACFQPKTTRHIKIGNYNA